MAHLWIEQASSSAGDGFWAPSSLDGAPAVPLLFPGDDVTAAEALLLCSRDGDVETWLLLCVDPAVVSLNGEVIHGGIRVLADHDEIRVAGRGRAFLSTERLARIESFPGTDRHVICPRCKQAIETGCSAVRCPSPSCGRWYHKSDGLPCWDYCETCVCSHPTALDEGYRWSPEGL